MEKLSAMGSLLAGVAHEINNPPAVVMAQSTLLADTAPDAATARRAERIRAAAERCGRIVKSFLAIARASPQERAPVDLNAVVRDTVEMLACGFRSAGITVQTALAPDLPTIHGDRDMLGQVAANLLVNAQQALMETAGDRMLRIGTARVAEGVRLVVEDNGPGVPEALREKIFDPYFTTKSAGVGTGIGLAISREVVAGHGGTLQLEDLPGGGARFVITLPPGEPAEPAAPGGSPAGPGPRTLRIFVVDDERDVGESLAEMLAALGHRPRVFDNAEAALAAAATDAPDAVFADLRMPRLDGVQLIARLTEARPGLAARSVIVTGDTVAGPAALDRLPQPPVVLAKPFLPEDVRAALARIA
jgi:CheY-like chemotaxis protein